MVSAALAFLVMLQTPAAQQPGNVQIFGDWTVGCDNGWACEAISLPSPDWESGNAYSITFRQSGGANGDSRIGIRSYEEEGPARIALRIDGEHAGTAERAPGDELYHFAPSAAQRIAGRLARGERAELHSPDGGPIEGISLDGSYAALLFIEDRQGRAGTISAVAAVGDEPLSGIPEPPAIPTVRAVLPPDGAAEPFDQEMAQALHDASGCDGLRDELRRNDTYRLDSDKDLILISCSEGAYNFSDIAFVFDRDSGTIMPARFDRAFAWGEAKDIPLLVNVRWTPSEGILSTYAKGRGLGDCGTAERFVWDGTMFRLIERREMTECRGSPHWITVWRANVVRE